MSSYANKYFEEFIPERDLKEAILTQSPVPENMDTVKKLDDFLKDLLKRKLMSKIQKILLRSCKIKREILWVH